MSLRLRCRSCEAAFVTSDDQAGQTVECPKCGAEQVAPRAQGPTRDDPPPLQRIKATTPSTEASNVFVPKEPRERKRSRLGLWLALGLIPVAIVGGVVAWPILQRWLDPRPRTMVERTAYDYLTALARGDSEAERRVGVVEDPPSIRSFRDLQRDETRNARTKGSFQPIGRLHRSIEKKFTYDQATGRFTPKDPLGPAAATLDALHEAKAKNEQTKIYEKMASGDPNEAMDAAIAYGGMFTKLSEGILSPRKLIPSYKRLVQEARPPLPENELALAMDYARHRESWDALLKRPFPTLKTDGPFLFEKAELTARVMDKLASSGDPPITLRLKLVRFRMDAIDTQWKVVSARRVLPGAPDQPEDEEGPDPEISPEPAKPSPGEVKLPTDLDLEGRPVDKPR